jgi:outer membrane protein OmpA-like peptidoglycan-associated protein
MDRRFILSAIATSPAWALLSAPTSFAQSAPRFVDMAGATPTRAQIIEALRTQQSLGKTRTRRLNLEPMLNAAPGQAADSTPRETLAVKSESPRLSFDQVTFEFGSARISREALPVLQEIGAALRSEDLRELRFLIEGHTDAKGALLYNMNLSARRAESVKRYLLTRHGLSSRRLLTAGKGPTDLHDPENPESGANRRVVLMAFDGEAVSA